jgi:hypothetical protein
LQIDSLLLAFFEADGADDAVLRSIEVSDQAVRTRREAIEFERAMDIGDDGADAGEPDRGAGDGLTRGVADDAAE